MSYGCGIGTLAYSAGWKRWGLIFVLNEFFTL